MEEVVHETSLRDKVNEPGYSHGFDTGYELDHTDEKPSAPEGEEKQDEHSEEEQENTENEANDENEDKDESQENNDPGAPTLNQEQNNLETNGGAGQTKKEKDLYILKLIEQLQMERALLQEKSKKPAPSPSGSFGTSGNNANWKATTPESQQQLVQLNKWLQNLSKLRNPADQENLDPSTQHHQQPYQNQKEQYEEPVVEAPEEYEPCPFEVSQAVAFTKDHYNLGSVFPGQICEEDLVIRNRTKQPLALVITARCNNKVYDDLDEYVWSLRKASILDYNDKFYVHLSSSSSISLKVALKAPYPNTKTSSKIEGEILIGYKNAPANQPMKKLTLEAQLEIPHICFSKELYIAPLKVPTIKLAYRFGKKQDFKIPLRNQSSLAVNVTYDFIHDPEYNCSWLESFCFPLSATIPANGLTLLTLVLKPSSNYMMNPTQIQKQNVKKMLLVKLKNSSLIYQFLLWVEVLP